MINNKRFPEKKTTKDNHKSRDLDDEKGKYNNKPYKTFKDNKLGAKKDFKNSYDGSKPNKFTNKSSEKFDRKTQQKSSGNYASKGTGSYAPKDKGSFEKSSNYPKKQSNDQKGAGEYKKGAGEYKKGAGNVVELKKINHLYNELMTKKKGLNVEDGRSKFKVIDDILKIISGILLKVGKFDIEWSILYLIIDST